MGDGVWRAGTITREVNIRVVFPSDLTRRERLGHAFTIFVMNVMWTEDKQ
jgi:hypothetical protein